MSHVVAIDTQVTDLPALQRACSELGLTLVLNQKTFAWFGKWVNDYHAQDAAFNLGIKPEDYGKCDHAIKVPGSNYEIGLVKVKGSASWKIVFDFYGTGREIQNRLGKKAEKLTQHYGLCRAENLAKAKGHQTVRERQQGRIRLRVTSSANRW